jgi:hypothetical protein
MPLPSLKEESLKHVPMSPCTDCADDHGGPGWDSDIPDGNRNNYYVRKVRPT